ncbi:MULTISPECIES: hypothetical protein [Paraclostridium]|nr:MULTISPECIES: hypothetical protein [Paraclostridium]
MENFSLNYSEKIWKSYIKSTIDGIKKGRDELLEKAIEVIKTK